MTEQYMEFKLEELEKRIKALEQKLTNTKLMLMEANINGYTEGLKNSSKTEQKSIGYWIELGCVGNDNYNFECSECHHTDTHSKTVKVNYCWYCGARMKNED